MLDYWAREWAVSCLLDTLLRCFDGLIVHSGVPGGALAGEVLFTCEVPGRGVFYNPVTDALDLRGSCG